MKLNIDESLKEIESLNQQEKLNKDFVMIYTSEDPNSKIKVISPELEATELFVLLINNANILLRKDTGNRLELFWEIREVGGTQSNEQ